MRRYKVRLAASRQLARDIWELEFTRPRGFDFLPGQHIRFHGGGLEREYTPVGAEDPERIPICVRREGENGFSSRLCHSAIGETFTISGPYGHFLYRAGNRPPVFVATGTGVAPFVAFARSGVTGFTLLQGAETGSGLIYGRQLEAQSRVYVPCLTRASAHDRGEERAEGQDDDQADGRVFHGRVTDYLRDCLPAGDYGFYLCGGRRMIQDALGTIDQRFPDSLVFTERFS